MRTIPAFSQATNQVDNPVDDPRYLAGIEHFNAGDFFEAHEVWEELWHECAAIDRRFVQSLIQAAVSLYHWGSGNAAGANTLLHRGRAKADDYPPVHHGLPLAELWLGVAATVTRNEPPPRIALQTTPRTASDRHDDPRR